jgi:hypothetical protein
VKGEAKLPERIAHFSNVLTAKASNTDNKIYGKGEKNGFNSNR